jgi:hypothetical protein
MRRLLANSLLAVMLGLFFAPAIVASVPQPVPICCRRGGVHHCAMTAEMMSADRTAFRCNNPCPMRQGAQLGSSHVALPISLSAQIALGRQSLIAGAVSCRHVTIIHSGFSRGPPPESL